MKKLFLLGLFMLAVGSASAEKKDVTFTVNPPLVCNNCENKVKENLRFEKGVKAVKPSAKKGVVEVTYDDAKTDVAGLQEGFRKIGYEATPVEATVCPENENAPCCAPVPQSCCEGGGEACCGAK